MGHFQVAFAFLSKRVVVQNHSFKSGFPLQVQFHANHTQFRTTMSISPCTRFEMEAQG